MYLKKEVIWKPNGDGSILYNTVTEEKFILNRTATRIFMTHYVNKLPFLTIVHELCLQYDMLTEQEAANDIEECLDKIYSTDFFSENEESLGFINLLDCEVSIDHASIEICRDCNLRCKHCYEGDVVEEKSYMPYESVKKIIRGLSELSVFSVVITGGEPLLHPDIINIIEELNKNKIRAIVFTNGQLITEELLKKIQSANVLLRFSLDGSEATVHDKIRGKGTYDNIINNVQLCNKFNIDIGFSCSVNNDNFDDYFKYIELAESLGASEIEASEVLMLGNAINNTFLELNEDKLEQLRVNSMIAAAKSKAYRKGMGMYNRETESEYCCSAGTSNLFIDVAGNVYPCNLFSGYKEYVAGNAITDELLDIWRYSPVFKQLRTINKTMFEGCSECEAINNCNGGCRARALIRSGDIFGKMEKQFCNTTRSLYKRMINNSVTNTVS